MASKPVTDPQVRLRLAALVLRKEKRLLIAIVISLVVAASLWLRVIAPQNGVWSPGELSNMDGLPLNPRGVAVEVTEAADEDRAQFVELQKDLAKQPPPDLLDSGTQKGGG